MAGAKPTQKTKRLNDLTLFDADFHIGIHDAELLIPYVESDVLREKMERWGLPDYAKTGWTLSYAQDIESGTTAHGHAADRAQAIEAMEEFSFDAVLATPGGVGLFLPRIRWTVVKNELATAYNDYVVENVVDPDEGVYGLFILPEWNVDDAVAEIDRMAAKPGMVGAASFVDPWSHSAGHGVSRDPIFRELADRDIPLCLHQSGKEDALMARNVTRESRVETTSLAFPFNAMSDMANMIMTGLFDKFPDLQILVQECGLNWIPFLAHRLDDQLQRYSYDVMLGDRKHRMGEKHLRKLPSEYVREHFYFSTQPVALPKGPKHSKAMLDMCGASESFLFSSDFPHGTIDVADWLFDNPGIDEELRARIAAENAADLFDITL